MIEILNPNSSTSVTQAIEEACYASPIDAASWRVQTLASGPPAIESREDAIMAGALVVEYARETLTEGDSLIVACHSDPGVQKARALGLRSSIIGIGEASMLVASGLGNRFGVLSLQAESARRKWEMVERLGLAARCVGVEPSGTSVLHGVAPDVDLTPYLLTAERLVAKGADVLVLGCAGMARLASLIERHAGIPVIEPVTAALGIAATRQARTIVNSK